MRSIITTFSWTCRKADLQLHVNHPAVFSISIISVWKRPTGIPQRFIKKKKEKQTKEVCERGIYFLYCIVVMKRFQRSRFLFVTSWVSCCLRICGSLCFGLFLNPYKAYVFLLIPIKHSGQGIPLLLRLKIKSEQLFWLKFLLWCREGNVRRLDMRPAWRQDQEVLIIGLWASCFISTFSLLLFSVCFFSNDLDQWEVAVVVTTAGDLQTSVCRVVIYLQRDMSGDRCLPQHHSQDDPTHPHPLMVCPKTKTCASREAVGLGNKYVRLNVGGMLFFTPLQVLTRQSSLLRAMFSGKKEVFTDKEG